MTFFEIIDLIAFYGVDVVLLAAATSVLTQILKNTLLKNAPNKLYTLLPFILGVIVYAVYTAISRVSFYYVFINFVSVLEQGIKTGGVATVVYIVYEQFVRGKTSLALSENALKALIADFVAEGAADAAVAEILKSPDRAEEIISAYKRKDADDGKIAVFAKLIGELIAPKA